MARAAAADQQRIAAYPLTDDRATNAAAALHAIAGLSDLGADTLANWPRLRTTVETSLRGASTPSAPIDPAASLSNVDLVVSRGQQALGAWFLQVAAANDAREKQTADLERYSSQAQSQISRYNQLRNEAADWLKRANASNTYQYVDALNYFDKATSDRRAVRDALASMTVPDDLRSQHDEILAILTEAVDGIQSMVDGLHANQRCYALNCALASTAGFQAFESHSAAITVRYGKAVDNLNARIWDLKAAAAATPTPSKPTV